MKKEEEERKGGRGEREGLERSRRSLRLDGRRRHALVALLEALRAEDDLLHLVLRRRRRRAHLAAAALAALLAAEPSVELPPDLARVDVARAALARDALGAADRRAVLAEALGGCARARGGARAVWEGQVGGEREGRREREGTHCSRRTTRARSACRGTRTCGRGKERQLLGRARSSSREGERDARAHPREAATKKHQDESETCTIRSGTRRKERERARERRTWGKPARRPGTRASSRASPTAPRGSRA